MSKISISNQKIQYENYGNYYLKAYVVDTNNAKIIYSSDEDVTGFDKVLLDVEGFTPFIPHISGRFDLWLFPSEDEADENITTNALKLASNVTAETLLENAQTADYLNVGTTQILTDSKINQTYDQIEAGGLIDYPEVYEVPNFITNRTQIQREIAGLGLGGDGLTLGDALITTRDLSLSSDYVREGSYFDRLAYPDFDNLLGAFVPNNTDFTKATFTENQIDPVYYQGLTTSINNTSIRSMGELDDDKLFYLRIDKLYIVNKIDMTIFSTINAPTDKFFMRAIKNTANQLIIATGDNNGSKASTDYEMQIYQLNIDLNAIEFKIETLHLNFNTNGSSGLTNDRFELIQDTKTLDYKLFINRLVVSGGNNSGFVCHLINFKNDFTESATTNLYISGTETISDSRYSIFYNSNTDQTSVLITNASISLNQNLSYRILNIDDTILNKTDGTNVSVTISDIFLNRLESLPLLELDSVDNFWSYNSNLIPIFDKQNNKIIIQSNVEQYLISNNSPINANSKVICFHIYNLSDYSLEKYYTSDKFIEQGVVNSSLTSDSIIYNVDYLNYNKIRNLQSYTFSNEQYIPILSGGSGSINTNGVLSFLNFDGDEPVFVKNNISFALTQTGNNSINFSTMNNFYFFDNNNDFYFLKAKTVGNTTGSLPGTSIYSIFKLIVDNGVITELKRPAPPIAALGVSKGYWKAV